MDFSKKFLDGTGIELLMEHIKSLLNTKLDKDEAESFFVKKSELNAYARTDTLSQYVSKTYVDNAIENYVPDNTELINRLNALEERITNAYIFKGSVNNLEELSSINVRQIGDVYNIREDGMNYAWTGSEWDNLGGLTNFPNTDETGS